MGARVPQSVSGRQEIPFGNCIAHRRYLWHPRTGKSRPVDVEIGTPVRARLEWACRVRIAGLPRKRDFDQAVYGVDALQALELALYAAGKVLAVSPEFRAGQIESWGNRVREPAALGLPLPFHSLQIALDSLRAFLQRRMKRGAEDEWRRGLLTVMREVSLDLATLATHLPIKPRRRERPGR